jgi:hypothetical protein
MHALKVGQILWFVPNRNYLGKPRHVEVTKIGSKWATLENGERIGINDLCVDGHGYGSPGRCYLSQQAYEIERETRAMWFKLYDAEGVDANAIRSAAAALGLKLE